MIIKTKDFGDISYEEEDLINFVKGIYGFDDYTKYLIVKDKPEDDIMFMQSVEDGELSFIIVDPYAVFPEYAPELNDEDLKALGVKNNEDLRFVVIAIIPEDMKKSVINLKSPIAIHYETKHAMQVIVQNTDYPLRYPLFHTDAGGNA